MWRFRPRWMCTNNSMQTLHEPARPSMSSDYPEKLEKLYKKNRGSPILYRRVRCSGLTILGPRRPRTPVQNSGDPNLFRSQSLLCSTSIFACEALPPQHVRSQNRGGQRCHVAWRAMAPSSNKLLFHYSFIISQDSIRILREALF